VEDRVNLLKIPYLQPIIPSTYIENGMKNLYEKEGKTLSFPFKIKF
jgi:hypothetical protein